MYFHIKLKQKVKTDRLVLAIAQSLVQWLKENLKPPLKISFVSVPSAQQ